MYEPATIRTSFTMDHRELYSEKACQVNRRVTRSMKKSHSEELEMTPQERVKPVSNSEVRQKRVRSVRAVDRSTHQGRRPFPSLRSRHAFPSLQSSTFGLIQERIAHNLYFLVVQAILWNQTSGIQARPIFLALIERYPDPESLAKASLEELTGQLRPLGLHNIRARRCIALGECWTKSPLTSAQRYRRKGYPTTPLRKGTDEEYEIAHLPGVGPYALDSFRIFHRDEMRGLADDRLGTAASDDDFEPEWKRVLPMDKELRAYLKWRWLKEGFMWNEVNGSVVRVSDEVLAAVESTRAASVK